MTCVIEAILTLKKAGMGVRHQAFVVGEGRKNKAETQSDTWTPTHTGLHTAQHHISPPTQGCVRCRFVCRRVSYTYINYLFAAKNEQRSVGVKKDRSRPLVTVPNEACRLSVCYRLGSISRPNN